MVDHHHGHVATDTERTGMGIFAALAVAALVGFLIWLFAFSGVVFNRSTNDGGGTQIENRIEQQNEPEPAPPAGT